MITNEVKFLLKHSSIYGLGTVISRIVGFILLPMYTKYLTPSDYGLLEMVDITSGIIGIVVTVGIAGALSRFYYEFEEGKERCRVVSTTYITYLVVASLFVPLLYYLSNPLSNILLSAEIYSQFFKVGFASLILGGLIDIGLLYLRIIKKPFIFITITITRLVFLITLNIYFIVYLQMGVLGILYSSLIVKFFYAFLLTTSVLWKTKVSFSLKLALDMLKYSLPLVPSGLATTLVKHSDRYFVNHFVSIADMGIYGIALKFGNAIHMLFTMPFNMAYIPRRFEIMKRDEAQTIYKKIFSYYIFLITYISLAVAMLIPEILQVMVTSKFLVAKEFVPLILLSMIIYGSQRHLNFGILYSKKTRHMAYINLTSALINLSLNFCLIRSYGLWGAVVSYLIVAFIQSTLMYLVSDRLYRIEYELHRIFMYIFIAFIFYIASTQLDTKMLILNIGLKLFLLTLFPFAIILLRIISPEESAKLKQIYTSKIKSPILNKLAIRTN